MLKGNPNFKVKLIAEGFNTSELEKLELARTHMEAALRSQKFFDFMTNFSFEETTCTGKLWWKTCTTSINQMFRYNNGKSRKEIYEHLLCGSEKLASENDGEADIFIKIDRRHNKRVLGYTYPNTSWQWVYSTFFGNSTYKEIAGNIAHEWCHKMGYDHEFRYSALREFTVPYAVGYFVRDFDSSSILDNAGDAIDKKIEQKEEGGNLVSTLKNT